MENLVRSAIDHIPLPRTLVTMLLLLDIIAIVLTVLAERILNYPVWTGFGENGPITWLSFVQL